MKIPIYQVDAFADKVFGGNPAAVCPLEEWLDDETMQAIAAENNLSETAFFTGQKQSYKIRWFTPETEVDLCGHATLASAHIIFSSLAGSADEIIFDSQSGKLRVLREDDKLILDFPARKPEPVDQLLMLVKGLGAEPEAVLKSRDYLAIFDSEETVRELAPDFTILKQIEATGIIVSAPGDNSDFVSRFFAPAVGINEDPVTGSAHCTLAPYWGERLNKDNMHAYQISKRGGELFCELKEDRVLIGGRAVTYLAGTIET